MRSFILWVLTLSGAFAGAVDLDHESAKRRYDTQKAIADGAEATYRADEREFQRTFGVHASEVSRENKLRQDLSSYESSLQSANSDITRLETDIPRIEADIRQKENERTNVESRIQQQMGDQQRRRHELQRDEGELRRVERELSDEQSKPTPDAARVASLQAEKSRCEQEVRRSRQALNQIDSDIQHNRNLSSNLNSQIQDLRANVSRKQADLNQANRTRQEQLINVQNARSDLSRQQDNVRMAQNRMEDARSQMNRSKAEFDRQTILAQRAYQEYQTVVANYNAEYNRVVSAAKADASAASEREAQDRAPTVGRQEGEARAVQLGNDKGTTEARTRELAAGYRSGKASTAQDKASYDAGFALGSQAADREAAAEDMPAGYNHALEATLASEPASVATFDLDTDQQPATREDGGVWIEPTPQTVGSVAAPAVNEVRDPVYAIPAPGTPTPAIPAADKRHYAPACANQLRPEFVGLCQNSYAAAYDAGFQTSYRRIHLENFQSAFAARVQGEYDRALKQAFPAEFKQGVAQGARDQGILSGYAARLPQARTEYFAKGESNWASTLASGHLVRLGSTRLGESSNDGLFTPGETASLTLAVDNLGGRPVPEGTLRALLSDAKGAVPEKSERAVPILRSNTRTILKGVVTAKIKPAQAGAAVALKGTLDRSGTTAKTMEAAGVVHFPVELQSLKLAAVPKVDQEVAGTMRFKNQGTAKSPAAPVSFTVSPQVATFAADAEIPEMEPGAEVDVAVKVKPGVWVGGNLEIPLTVDTENLGGITGPIAQNFPVGMSIDRSASLELYGWDGLEVRNANIDVVAGQRLRFQVVFKLHRNGFTPGPFWVGVAKTSDPTVRSSSGTTVGTTLGSVSPNSRFGPMAFQFDIPASMKGKSGWVLISLREGNRHIHVVQVGFNAR